MKALILTAIVTTALAIPALSFAQQAANGPLTRADVRAQLATAQHEGLVHQPKNKYPEVVSHSLENGAHLDASGYGPVQTGTSQTAAEHARTDYSLFAHH
ncbi:DUF4148 domain-containing protein [Paraburkholderia sediminicola]|uniref:DUF4148 domain-containing protein n=1 Tax=Paraburkholderia sediminicola TaxID=458836 RepID=UPI0038B7B9B1